MANFVFIFADDRKVILPPGKVMQKFSEESAFIEMLIRRNENVVNMQKFCLNAFHNLVESLEISTKCKLEYLHQVVEIACYFMLRETFFESVLPAIP